MILNREQIPFSHKARQITVNDFENFDFILGMDNYNLSELNRYAEALNCKARVQLLGDYNSDSSERIIVDPYFDNDPQDFEKCFTQIVASCSEFLKFLIQEKLLSAVQSE